MFSAPMFGPSPGTPLLGPGAVPSVFWPCIKGMHTGVCRVPQIRGIPEIHEFGVFRDDHQIRGSCFDTHVLSMYR
jgi:hypothetical protein